MTVSKPCILLDLNLMEYGRVWHLQHKLVDLRAQKRIPDAIILVEHPAVITLGRRGDRSQLIQRQYPVFEIERGGQATYHGPGQLVSYPIINLADAECNVHEYVRRLEELLIRVLRDFNIESGRAEGLPGVWTEGRKIASIGVAAKYWVTYHGFALNVNTDLSHFESIKPCGLGSEVMTSMQRILGANVDFEAVKRSVKVHFEEVFDRSLTPAPVDLRLVSEGSHVEGFAFSPSP
ncbi:MAG: lipoyl(octanoyl) transferase LipB [Candidatus Bathyarchaeia archaeon]